MNELGARWYVLQAIDPELGCPTFEVRFAASRRREAGHSLAEEKAWMARRPTEPTALYLDEISIDERGYVTDEGVERIKVKLGMEVDTSGMRVRIVPCWGERVEAPFLIHDGYELALMLEGRKPLSVFEDREEEFEETKRLFRPFVERGRLVWKELASTTPRRRVVRDATGVEESRPPVTAYATLPKEAWRVGAYRNVQRAMQAEGSSFRLLPVAQALLGYDDKQIAWLSRRRDLPSVLLPERSLANTWTARLLLLTPIALFLYVLFGTAAGVDLVRAGSAGVIVALKLAAGLALVGVVGLAGAVPFASLKTASWILGIGIGLVIGVAHSPWLGVLVFLIIGRFSQGWMRRLKDTISDGPSRLSVLLLVGVIAAITFFPVELGFLLGSALMLATVMSSAAWLLLFLYLRPARKEVNFGVLFLLGFTILFCNVLGVIFFNEIRESTVEGPTNKPLPSLDEAYDEWKKRQTDHTPQMVIVAASGGGIRASYWTSLILAKATERAPSLKQKLFLASGVSGGSLGLAVYSAALSDARNGRLAEDAIADRVKAFHGYDFLAPPLGSTVTGHALNAVLGWNIFPERNSALERGWELAWSFSAPGLGLEGPNSLSAGFRDVAGTGGPVLVLNATSVRSGDRLIVSNVATTSDWPNTISPCSLNIAERLDLPLSAAAGVSARFPYLSDWSWFTRPKTASCYANDAAADGGFVDNYGALTAVEALERLLARSGAQKTIVVQITSDPETWLDAPKESPLPRHFIIDTFYDFYETYFGPLMYWLPGWSEERVKEYLKHGRENAALMLRRVGVGPQALSGPLGLLLQSTNITGLGPAKRLQEVARDHGRYFHFTMRGATTAPLSWVLSPRARSELDDLLDQEPNKTHFKALVEELNRSQ